MTQKNISKLIDLYELLLHWFVLLSPTITVQNNISRKKKLCKCVFGERETIIKLQKQNKTKRLLSIINIAHDVVCIIIKS